MIKAFFIMFASLFGFEAGLFAGTGLGHVNKPLYPALQRARDKGISVFMTVQTL